MEPIFERRLLCPAPHRSVAPREVIQNLIVATHDQRPVSRFIQQWLVLDTILRVHENHRQLFEKAATEASVPTSALAKGLCLRGSGTLPFSLRRSHDLDFTVNIGSPYDPRAQALLFHRMFELAFEQPGRAKNVRVYTADLNDASLFPHRVQALRHENLLSVLYVVADFEPSDAAPIREHLAKLFDFPGEELSVLDTFTTETIKQIVNARLVEAERSGRKYTASADEQAGRSLRIVIPIDIVARDSLNIYAPNAMGIQPDGKFAVAFTSRTCQLLDGLTFSSSLEEGAAKVFSLVTFKERMMIADRLAKDLVDLFIRTRPARYPDRAFAPFFAERQSLMGLVRATWPAHPAFYDQDLYFKKIDPSAKGNLKQVRNGLLTNQARGTIGSNIFGTVISEDNADLFATILLEHAWELVRETFGVVRGGSNNNPTYSVEPAAPIQAFWSRAREMRDLVAVPLPEGDAESRANDFITELETLLVPITSGHLNGNGRGVAALDVYLRMDRGRRWSGLIG
jgi:hypothetical protein